MRVKYSLNFLVFNLRGGMNLDRVSV